MDKNILERMEISFEVEANLSGCTVMWMEVVGLRGRRKGEGEELEEEDKSKNKKKKIFLSNYIVISKEV
jgi:hypothetical protein